MWKDPIVEELHRIRESMLAENGNDLAAMAHAANARVSKPINGATPLTPLEQVTRKPLVPSST
jgi:hypothetical protein